MTPTIFDLETDGLLDEVTTIHSVVIKENDHVWSAASNAPGAPGTALDEYRRSSEFASPGPFDRSGPRYTLCGVHDAVERLHRADCLVGHNIIGYDLPVLRKLRPKPRLGPHGLPKLQRQVGLGRQLVLDTILLGRLTTPAEKLLAEDSKLVASRKMPGYLAGAYSLEAYGYRLGDYKGDYKGGWEAWSPAMQAYCEQDVQVSAKLWAEQEKVLRSWGLDPFDPAPAPGKDAIRLEHEVAEIIHRQERTGFTFDKNAALTLYKDLSARRAALETQLQNAFPPEMIETPFIPKSNNSKLGYRKGELFTKRKLVSFNPSSRQQVAARLQKLGWKPKSFTATGIPEVNDDTLSDLFWPEAKLLAEYYMIEKRIGQLAEGKQAWLKSIKASTGRIHGRVTTNGAVTGRMTHQRPNMAQVPSGSAPYGKECRALFTAGPGLKLVGVDADALELRCLAHYMAKHDGGAYIKTILEGRKEDGTDMHSVNARALGCSRDTAKTWFYAFIYGAGDHKLGVTLGATKNPKRSGGEARARFLRELPAMGKLVKMVKQFAEANGYMPGLDGRRVFVRSGHAALNSLLQSAGAILMKRALVIADRDLTEAGLSYAFVGNIHDEWQIEAHPDHAEQVGRIAAEAIAKAGEFYGFRCPLKGNFDIGFTWANTH